ncbi:MAG: hypothetical protein IGQ88_02780 [Gloeomargaritaceae cyanobacterium C42_A2020_066]|nr:hypothetical protein [Gloeomargaritaceae cyanobacterium C42_A2020_066]
MILWILFLLGLLFHVQLGLMPLFHGLDVTVSPAENLAAIGGIIWLMLAFFLLPLVAILGTAFTTALPYRLLHFGFTILYSVLNFFHLLADIFETPVLGYQITLMGFLFAIGLWLNVVSWRWWHGRP